MKSKFREEISEGCFVDFDFDKPVKDSDSGFDVNGDYYRKKVYLEVVGSSSELVIFTVKFKPNSNTPCEVFVQ